MSVDQVSTFLGLLAILAIGIGLVGLIAAVGGRNNPTIAQLRPLLLPVSFAVAATAMLGSLYYSESANYTPCLYCWYQRICMYPLVAILAVAWWRRERQWGFYALPFSLIGLGFSVYHYQLQQFPDQESSCDASAPCTAQWVDTFGFMSIPFMAGCGFLAITAAAILSLRLVADDSDDAGFDEPVASEVSP